MGNIGLEVSLILLLVLANGLFSMAEMAVVSSRKARLRQRAEEGSKGAAVALALAANPHDFLSTVQVGITMIGTLAGRATDMSLGKIVAKWLTVSGSTLRPQTPSAKAEIAARMRSDLWPALGDVVLPRPKVQALPIAAAAEAHRLLESRAHFGKIVLVTAFGAGQIR